MDSNYWQGFLNAEEMSRSEFVEDMIERRGDNSGRAKELYGAQHERMVRRAAREGLPISAKALNDYHDLARSNHNEPA